MNKGKKLFSFLWWNKICQNNSLLGQLGDKDRNTCWLKTFTLRNIMLVTGWLKILPCKNNLQSTCWLSIWQTKQFIEHMRPEHIWVMPLAQICPEGCPSLNTGGGGIPTPLTDIMRKILSDRQWVTHRTTQHLGLSKTSESWVMQGARRWETHCTICWLKPAQHPWKLDHPGRTSWGSPRGRLAGLLGPWAGSRCAGTHESWSPGPANPLDPSPA